MEAYTVTELKALAKTNQIPGYSKMRKQELLDALKKNKGVTVQPKSPAKKPQKASTSSKSDCEKQTRATIVSQAMDVGITIGKKTKAQLCDEIKSLEDVQECIDIAESVGIKNKKVRKEICEQAVRKTSKKRVSPKRVSPKRVSPKRVSPKRVSPKRVSPKRVSPKRVSPKRVSPKRPTIHIQETPKRPTPGSSPLKPAMKQQSRTIEITNCEKQLKADIVAQAKKLKIQPGNKTKPQLCAEIVDKTKGKKKAIHAISPSPVSSDKSNQADFPLSKWMAVVEELTGQQYLSMTPKELAKLVPLDTLIKYVRRNNYKGFSQKSASGITQHIFDEIELEHEEANITPRKIRFDDEDEAPRKKKKTDKTKKKVEEEERSPRRKFVDEEEAARKIKKWDKVVEEERSPRRKFEEEAARKPKRRVVEDERSPKPKKWDKVVEDERSPRRKFADEQEEARKTKKWDKVVEEDREQANKRIVRQQETRKQKTWNDVVFELTGEATNLIPRQLAEKVERQTLREYAINVLGINLCEKLGKKENVAKMIYEYVTNLATLKQVVGANITDHRVKDNIVKSVSKKLRSPEDNAEKIVIDAINEAEEAGEITGNQSAHIRNELTNRILSPIVEGTEISERLVSARNINRIEEILHEIRAPDAKVSELANVQKRVYTLLGLM